MSAWSAGLGASAYQDRGSADENNPKETNMSGHNLLSGLLLSAGLSVVGLSQPAQADATTTPSQHPKQTQFCVSLDGAAHGVAGDPAPNCGCSGGNCVCKPK